MRKLTFSRSLSLCASFSQFQIIRFTLSKFHPPSQESPLFLSLSPLCVPDFGQEMDAKNLSNPVHELTPNLIETDIQFKNWKWKKVFFSALLVKWTILFHANAHDRFFLIYLIIFMRKIKSIYYQTYRHEWIKIRMKLVLKFRIIILYYERSKRERERETEHELVGLPLTFSWNDRVSPDGWPKRRSRPTAVIWHMAGSRLNCNVCREPIMVHN